MHKATDYIGFSAIFFLLGALTMLGNSLFSAFFLLIAAVACTPPIRQKVYDSMFPHQPLTIGLKFAYAFIALFLVASSSIFRAMVNGPTTIKTTQKSTSASTSEPSASVKPAVQSKKEKILIPEYHVIEKELRAPVKASVTVKIKSEYSKEQIEVLAKQIRKEIGGKFERVFIFYLTPEMQMDGGAYATSHYNPGLEVKILSITKSEKANALAQAPKSDVNLIGRWSDPITKMIITFKKSGANEAIMTWTMSDGSLDYNLRTRVVGGQTQYYEPGDDPSYYIIKNGTLYLYDGVHNDVPQKYSPVK